MFFWGRVWPWTHGVSPAFASWIMGLKVCTTIPSLILIFKSFILFLCGWVLWLHVYLRIPFMPDAHWGQRRATGALGLELQLAITTAWVLGVEPRLWKSSQCSSMSHLYNPLFLFIDVWTRVLQHSQGWPWLLDTPPPPASASQPPVYQNYWHVLPHRL